MRASRGRWFCIQKSMERESSYSHYTTVLYLTNIEFSRLILKDISKFDSVEGDVDQRIRHRE